MRLGQAPPGSFRAAQEVGLEQEDVDQKSLYDRTVANFLQKIKAFYDNLKGLQLQAGFVNAHPELKPEYDALMQRGSFIDTQIKNAKALIEKAQSAWDWLLSTIGLGSLGVLPALPIAITAGAAAITLITKWLADVYVFSRKVEAIKQAEAAGAITGREATEAILRAGPTGILDVLQKNIIWIVVGGALLLFGPELIKWIQRR